MNVIVVTGLGKHKRKKRAMRKGKPTTMIPTHAPKECKRSSVGKRLRLHANEESGVRKKDMCRRGNERGLKSGLCAALVTAEEGQGGGLKAAVCSLLSREEAATSTPPGAAQKGCCPVQCFICFILLITR